MSRPIDSYVNIWRSIKKFFVDTMETQEGIPVYFDRVRIENHEIDVNRLTKWIIVDDNDVYHRGNEVVHTISIVLHTRDDSEADKLNVLRDQLFKYIYVINETDQIARLELFDTTTDPWISIGHALIFIDNESQIYYTDDGTTLKYINISLRWTV